MTNERKTLDTAPKKAKEGSYKVVGPFDEIAYHGSDRDNKWFKSYEWTWTPQHPTEATNRALKCKAVKAPRWNAPGTGFVDQLCKAIEAGTTIELAPYVFHKFGAEIPKIKGTKKITAAERQEDRAQQVKHLLLVAVPKDNQGLALDSFKQGYSESMAQVLAAQEGAAV